MHTYLIHTLSPIYIYISYLICGEGRTMLAHVDGIQAAPRGGEIHFTHFLHVENSHTRVHAGVNKGPHGFPQAATQVKITLLRGDCHNYIFKCNPWGIGVCAGTGKIMRCVELIGDVVQGMQNASIYVDHHNMRHKSRQDFSHGHFDKGEFGRIMGAKVDTVHQLGANEMAVVLHTRPLRHTHRLTEAAVVANNHMHKQWPLVGDVVCVQVQQLQCIAL